MNNNQLTEFWPFKKIQYDHECSIKLQSNCHQLFTKLATSRQCSLNGSLPVNGPTNQCYFFTSPSKGVNTLVEKRTTPLPPTLTQ